MLKSNQQLELAYNFVNYTNSNLFLTGKAGTGKTTFLKNLKNSSPKRMVVVAPTGVAAINAGGVTIHSFFQLPLGPQVPEYAASHGASEISSAQRAKRFFRFARNKINLIRTLDLLVIDEISMVRADLLDAIDATLRRFKNRTLPFGGVQLLMIGDLRQLAPVIKDDEWEILKKYYETGFFFSSHALKKSNFIGIELAEIFRQSEQGFIDLLNKVRENTMRQVDLQLLNSRFIPGFSPSDEEGYITLTTHNYQAKQINDSKLNNLTTQLQRFKCEVQGEFPQYSYPADEILEIKPGAQVMFLKNDSSAEKRYYNGKIGKVLNINDTHIRVVCPGDDEPIDVERETWESIKYRLNEITGEIEEEPVGKFVQFPLKLAWAITIHKSQGLTFEKAVIDARQSFAHGQVYVALSRCRSLSGLVLSTPISMESVISDETVVGFSNEVKQNQPDEQVFEKYRKSYELQLFSEMFDFKSLLQKIIYLLKVWNENASSLMGNINEKMQNSISPIRTEMIDVAEKFQTQLKGLMEEPGFAEENIRLQERLKKAAGYFLKKISEHIEVPLSQSRFDSDNRAIHKRIGDILTQIETELSVIRAGIESVEKGFSVKEYLKARALASMEKPSAKTKRESASMNTTEPELYKKIVKWRNEKSMDTGMETSKIISLKVILEISNKIPSTVSELKAIKGMGSKKMELFGQDILALTISYRHEKGMDIPLNAHEEIEIAGLNTKELSLMYFRQGLTPQEIARKRNLTESTIIGHLAFFVEKGELEIFELISQSKSDVISHYIRKKGEAETISDIKNKLGNNYSYSEIKLVMAHMNKQLRKT
jgi:hypothetical protein